VLVNDDWIAVQFGDLGLILDERAHAQQHVGQGTDAGGPPPPHAGQRGGDLDIVIAGEETEARELVHFMCP
jgi:hypothetical protein